MFTLSPGELSINDIESLLQSKQEIKLASSAYASIKKSYEIVQRVIREDKTVYGINTGFGLLANTKVNDKNLKDLQRRIILSHAAGVGPYLHKDIVQLVMLLKINSLSRGYSGVSIKLVDKLIEIYNSGIIPLIPEKGSVGASGDLAPLAHMSMILIGEGKVLLDNQEMSSEEALKLKNITPIELCEKEGLSLINGTQVSTSIAILGLIKVKRNFSIATISGAMVTDAVAGSQRPFQSFIAKAKNCQGQKVFSKVINNLLEGSEIIKSHKHCNRVQDPYSVRCQGQVMGAILNYLKVIQDDLLDEANGVSDNPLVDPDTKIIVSGGNFHAEKTGFGADLMSILCSEIGAISERRVSMLIDSNLSGLPAFLVNEPGLNSGFMIAHVTASALASANKTLAHPATIDSLPTSANQEDHVSMATFAAVKLLEIAENVLQILAVETLAACQGIDFRSPLKTSSFLACKVKTIRTKIPFYNQDRYFAVDINNCAELIQNLEYYKEVEEKIFND